MGGIQLQRVEEFHINPGLRQEIAGLLERSFPGYPGKRTYFMQLPAFRFLATLNGSLVGHLAVEHRMINVSGDPARIFGVADLCVERSFQHQGVGTLLLESVFSEGITSGVDFVVLVASNQEFYYPLGFISVNNPCRWVSIQEHQTLEVVQRRLAGDVLVKSLSGKKWGEGLVDFLGTMF